MLPTHRCCCCFCCSCCCCCSYEARRTLRWYSSWVLIVACIPVLTMYGMWIYHTIAGNIVHDGMDARLPMATHGNSSGERSDLDCVHEGSSYNLQPIHRSDPASSAVLMAIGVEAEEGTAGHSEASSSYDSARKLSFLTLPTPYQIVAQTLPSKLSLGGISANSSSDFNGDNLQFTENPLSSSLLPPSPPEQNGKNRNASYIAPCLDPSSLPLTRATSEQELNMNEFEVMEL